MPRAWIFCSLIGCLVAAPLSAQASRISLVPQAGYASPSPIFTHDVRWGAGVYRSRATKRLALQPTPTVGARLEYQPATLWTIFADGAYGIGRFTYTERSEAWGPDDLYGEEEQWHRRPARIATFVLGVGRSLPLRQGMPELGLNLGVSAQRFRLEKRLGPCPPPSAGFTCGPAEPWDATYTIPGGAGGVTLRHALSPRVGLQLGATYGIGQANTEGFWTDLVPELDEHEAPRSQWVRTASVSLGLSMRP